MSAQPAGTQLKVVASVPPAGLMLTLLIEGAVFPITTAALVTPPPESSPSYGVAVQAIESPASKEVPSMISAVTEGLPLTVQAQV